MSDNYGVDTAVIIAAGNGTRRLPITRVVDKAMLPIGNRPTIDYVVEQCIVAGITNVVFIVSKPDTLVRVYYGDSIDIAVEYPWLGVSGSVAVRYVVQDVQRYGYGTASAVHSAEDALQGAEHFVVVAADAFLRNAENTVVTKLIEACDSDFVGSIGGMCVPAKDIVHYGRIESDETGKLIGLIEKDSQYVGADDPMANISYHVLHRDIFPIIVNLEAQNNEFYLTDALLQLSKQAGVKVVPMTGVYLDSGTIDKWVEANQYVLAHDMLQI